MAKINEATDTDLKIIDELKKLGWKVGDTLLYQQEYSLTPEQQKQFEGRKSIKPDITLLDLNHNIVAIFENKFEDEKKACFVCGGSSKSRKLKKNKTGTIKQKIYRLG